MDIKEEVVNEFDPTKLYGLYSVVSNKTVRNNEKHYVSYYKKNKDCPGFLIKTGRGYFIDGHQVDQKSVQIWADMNEGLHPFKPRKKYN